MDESLRRDPRRRLTVDQAADQLGVSVDAVRARIKRGTIGHEREGGRVYVLLDADQDTDQSGESSALISQLRDEIAYLRDENRRKDELLAAALSRIPPQLEPARESTETTEDAPEGAEHRSGTDEPQRGEQAPLERPWWQFWR